MNKTVEVHEVSFWNAATDETVTHWVTAPGLQIVGRQCRPTGARKEVDAGEVSNEIWRGDADAAA